MLKTEDLKENVTTAGHKVNFVPRSLIIAAWNVCCRMWLKHLQYKINVHYFLLFSSGSLNYFHLRGRVTLYLVHVEERHTTWHKYWSVSGTWKINKIHGFNRLATDPWHTVVNVSDNWNFYAIVPIAHASFFCVNIRSNNIYSK